MIYQTTFNNSTGMVLRSMQLDEYDSVDDVLDDVKGEVIFRTAVFAIIAPKEKSPRRLIFSMSKLDS